jgi:probable F420-dependent oxidoreductase
MARFKVGVQLHPQATTVDSLLEAAEAFDELGVDSIWLWDHFFPLYGDPGAAHFEAYTVLAAMAQRTRRAGIGVLVTCMTYRNPNLLADMARTVDHLAGGRMILGLGAGWFERDYTEYGYPFEADGVRLAHFERDLHTLEGRLGRLSPPPVGPMPILIGGSGRKVTLRIVAERADMWNSFGPPENFAELNAVLDEWCHTVDRNPASIERTVAINPSEVGDWQAYLDAGAEHLIVMTGAPFAVDEVAALLDASTG